MALPAAVVPFLCPSVACVALLLRWHFARPGWISALSLPQSTYITFRKDTRPNVYLFNALIFALSLLLSLLLPVCMGEIGVAFEEELNERVHGHAEAYRTALYMVGGFDDTAVCLAPWVV